MSGCRLSQLAKGGGESFLFDSLHATVAETDKTLVIIVRINNVAK